MIVTGSRLGSYEILEPIGSGGMGEVYRARDTKLGRDVALKVLPEHLSLDPDRLARLKREAHVLASLNHPNIAAIYGFEEADGRPALVLELVEGATLADRVGQGPIGLDEALPIAQQICEALEAAHEHGIVHRDLKPANIKLRPDGLVKVLDFGLAKIVESGGAGAVALSESPTITTPAMTGVGVILGTAPYMSPEQARGRPTDRRSDIWAFGVLLLEMLTNKAVFTGESASEVLTSVMKDAAPLDRLPLGTPPAIRNLIRRCLEKDPRRRVQGIGEARITIEDVLSGTPVPQESPARLSPSRPWGWIAATAVCLLSLGLVVTLYRVPPSSPRVLRYSIPLPKDGLTLGFAISPDGRFVAINAVVEKTSHIFVRSLDSGEFRELPGTEYVTRLFWSPDSRYLGFFADGKLKKVAVNGGPAEEISSVPTLGASGSWGRDVILVARLRGSPLLRVPATGGAAIPLSTVEGGVSHRYPCFLPDGRHFLYTSAGGSSPGIYLASLDDPRGRRLLSDQSNALFAPPVSAGGNPHLVFSRDGRLMAQPLARDSLELAGDAFLVADRALFGDDESAAVSVSGDGLLAYLGGSHRETDSRLTWFHRSGKVLATEGPIGPLSPVGLSPDEKAIAFVRRQPWLSIGDVWLREVARAVRETRFTFTNAVVYVSNLVWSPDRSRIAFSSADAGSVNLYWKDVRSDHEESILPSGNSRRVTDWSRDGRFLLYTEINPKTRAELWYLPLDPTVAPSAAGTRKPVPFLQAEFNASSGQLSPDARWIAYISNESGEYEVYVRPFPSGAGKWKVSANQAFQSQQPRWSRDGSELFYFTGPAVKFSLMAVPVKARPSLAPNALPMFDIGTPTPLFEVRANSMNPVLGSYFYSVSVDSQRFLIDHIDVTADPVLNMVVNWERAVAVSK